MRGMTPDASRALDVLRRRLYRLLDNGPEEAVVSTASPWTPAADIGLAADRLVLLVELPGVERDRVEVNIQGSTVTVSGERQRPAEDRERRFRQAERPWGRFSRSFTVPWVLDADSASARLEAGVLTVTAKLAPPQEVAR